MFENFLPPTKREPINIQEWHKPGAGVYHKRGGPFDSLFYDYLTQ